MKSAAYRKVLSPEMERSRKMPLGAKLGLQGIPEKYTEKLELKEVILEIADDLYHDCQMSEYDYEHRDPVWVQKYIEMSYSR
jgi:hypothetical protein